MTSKLVVNTIESDTGISSVSFASSISMSSTSKFFFSAAGIDIGADTNINRPEAGVLGFNINGGEKLRIRSDGKVGISSSIPTEALEVRGNIFVRGATSSDKPKIKFGFSNAVIQGGKTEGNVGTDHLVISGNGGIRDDLVVTYAGNIGIGTVTPLSSLDVRGTTHALGNGGAALVWGNTSSLGTLSYSGTNAVVTATNNLVFNTNNAERLSITSTGTVEFKGGEGGTDAISVQSEASGQVLQISNFRGVTDTGDTTRLGVGKNNNILMFTNASGSQVDNFAIGNTDSIPLVFSTHNKKRLVITGSGIVQFSDNQAAYTNTTHTHSGEAGFITHYTARTTYGGADLYRRMLDIASGGANPHGSSIRFLTSNNNSNPATCIERMRIMDEGGVFIGTKTHAQRYSHAEAPALLTVQNGARVTTNTSVYAAPKGGFCDHARYELEQKLISISNSNLNIVQARNGQPLGINEARTGWDRYTNLPNYLLGHAATDNINNTNFTLTLYANMTVFLLRSNGWNSVDLTGWNLIESNTSIGPAASDTRLYVKSLAAGSYSNFDNDSAMYFFVL